MRRDMVMFSEWMDERPVKLAELLAWIENDEIGMVSHTLAVQSAVVAWAKDHADFEPDSLVTCDELTAVLCEGGMSDVESLVSKRMREAATAGMVWGAITAFQRLNGRLDDGQITEE